MLQAGLSLVVDDAPRLTRLAASATERVLAEEDSERRRRAVEVLKKALRNRRNKDKKKAAKRRAASAEPDAAPAADACADRIARADPRAESIRAAMRAHGALHCVRQELERVDTFCLETIDSGDGRGATIRRLLQECLDRIGPAVAAPAATEPHDALVALETQSIIYKFVSRLLGVGIGTLRMLRRSAVEKLESTAAVLLQTLVEERACREIAGVPTGADAADALPGDGSV